jgi:hypothetical protein
MEDTGGGGYLISESRRSDGAEGALLLTSSAGALTSGLVDWVAPQIRSIAGIGVTSEVRALES